MRVPFPGVTSEPRPTFLLAYAEMQKHQHEKQQTNGQDR